MVFIVPSGISGIGARSAVWGSEEGQAKKKSPVTWWRYGPSNLICLFTAGFLAQTQEGDSVEQAKNEINQELSTISVVSALFVSITTAALFQEFDMGQDMSRQDTVVRWPKEMMDGPLAEYNARLIFSTLLCTSSFIAFLCIGVSVLIMITLNSVTTQEDMQLFMYTLGHTRRLPYWGLIAQAVSMCFSILHFFLMKYITSATGCIPLCVIIVLFFFFNCMNAVHASRVVVAHAGGGVDTVVLGCQELQDMLERHEKEVRGFFHLDREKFLHYVRTHGLEGRRWVSARGIHGPRKEDLAVVSQVSIKLAGKVFDRHFENELQRQLDQCPPIRATLDSDEGGSGGGGAISTAI